MDRDLVEQARRGDREAFAVLVHEVGPALRGLLADPARLGSRRGRAAERPRARLAPDPAPAKAERFEAWIHRILVHACYDKSQRARQWTANVRVLPIDGPIDPRGSPPSPTATNWTGFRRLPMDQRAVFVLHHYLGLPLVEIAEMSKSPRARPDALRHSRPPRRPHGRCGARGQRRTPRMTDDRSLERAARSWSRPAQHRRLTAPSRPPSSGSRTPHRNGMCGSRGGSPHANPARVAAAALIGVLLVGGAVYSCRQGRSVSAARAFARR